MHIKLIYKTVLVITLLKVIILQYIFPTCGLIIEPKLSSQIHLY